MKEKSAAYKGNYYKLRSRDWLKNKGYAVAILEKLQQIHVKGRDIFLKRDCFGADGMAMNGKDIIFWNSILGKSNLSKHVAGFAQYPYPPCVKLWVLIWEEGAHDPAIKEVKIEHPGKSNL